MTATGSGRASSPRRRDSVLVTGGAGFIGCNLADRLLREGRHVVVLDDLSRPGSHLNLAWLQARHDAERLTVVGADVRDASIVEAAVAGAEVVFHLAGQTAVATSIVDPKSDFEVNLVGTLNILEAARARRRPPTLVYASTNKVYGDLEDQLIVEEPTRYAMPRLPHGIPETTPLALGSPYACSKGAGDQYVLAYAQAYSLPTVVLRQSCVYGPRQLGSEDQGWAAWLILAGAQGFPATIFGSGKQVRDLLYIDDLVDAYVAAVDAIDRTAGRAYNIGGGPQFAVSVWHEFSALLHDLGLAVPSVDFVSSRLGDQRVFVCDTRRATADFGWAPKISPAEGVALLGEWIGTAADVLGPLVVGDRR